MRAGNGAMTQLRDRRRCVAMLLGTLIGIAAGGAPTAGAATTIKLGHLQAPANHQQQAALRFAELVAQKTRSRSSRPLSWEALGTCWKPSDKATSR